MFSLLYASVHISCNLLPLFVRELPLNQLIILDITLLDVICQWISVYVQSVRESGQPVDIDSVVHIDLVVVGCVAVSPKGTVNL